MRSIYRLELNEKTYGILRWYTDPQRDGHFQKEAMGAAHLLEFIDSDKDNHSVEADGFLAFMGRYEDNIVITITGKGKITHDHPEGIGACLIDLMLDDHAVLLEYHA